MTGQSAHLESHIIMTDSVDDFDTFLAEVEALSIQYGDVTVQEDKIKPNSNSNDRLPSSVECERGSTAGLDRTSGNGIECQTIPKAKYDKKILRREKECMIQNATDRQQAWSEFIKVDLSKNNLCSPLDDINRQKISFKISSGTSKCKKKKKMADTSNGCILSEKPVSEKDEELCPTKKKTCNKPSGGKCSQEFLYPHWTLVIDTSSMVNDNGFEAQRIIDLANHISLIRYKWRNHNNNRQYSSANILVEEPIKIVIPYKVWSELEYQSKSDNTDLAYSARVVIRMLRDEIKQSNNQIDITGPSTVVQTQSVMQSRDAAKKFVSNDLTCKPTNDDHIIACALYQQELLGSTNNNVSGGVVIITSDNNMVCKALSNSLKVFSASDFHAYYLERLGSLQRRSLR